MKSFYIKGILALGFICLFGFNANAQCDSIANLCMKNISNKFISDGQEYRALLLNSEETAEFKTTFFAGTTYRVAACSGTSDGNLIFTIYDKNRNLIFSNKDFKNSPYWDFKIKGTTECVIEAKLDAAKNAGSGCAVILIGFKQ